MLALIREKGIREIPSDSPLYPPQWRELSDAPPVVYAVGNVALLRERKITIVGSRRTPAHALRLGTQIAKELASAFVVVTGTADGGDSAAIEGGLASGRIISISAGGFSALPQSNLALLRRVASEGLLLSPHPFESTVRAYSYEYRNKLLAVLGEGTLVLGAAEKSGALITARYAKRFQKPIFALPYAPGSAVGGGCNALLKQGGVLTETAEDVAAFFNVELRARNAQAALSSDEARVYAALKEFGEGHISEIATRSGLPSYKLRSVLSALEIKGLAVAVGGNRYAPV